MSGTSAIAKVGKQYRQYFGLEITNHSGHYLPDEPSLEIGKEAFQMHGITFP